LTSSAGRLFDALSAMLGVCLYPGYEGQAATELEMMTSEGVMDTLPYSIREGLSGTLLLDMMPAFSAILEMIEAEKPTGLISGMFHATMAGMLAEASLILAEQHPDAGRTVYLGGGVFQNRIFCDLLSFKLGKKSLSPRFHRTVPTNDGGISLGQAVCALHAMAVGEIQVCA
jgi:hydrogenase maturation protein HypF